MQEVWSADDVKSEACAFAHSMSRAMLFTRSLRCVHVKNWTPAAAAPQMVLEVSLAPRFCIMPFPGRAATLGNHYPLVVSARRGIGMPVDSAPTKEFCIEDICFLPSRSNQPRVGHFKSEVKCSADL